MKTGLGGSRMRETAVNVESVRRCGAMAFRDLRRHDGLHTPLAERTVLEGNAVSLDSANGIAVEDGQVLLFDLGRVIKGTFELEANVPEGAKVVFGIGEAGEPLRTYPAVCEGDGAWRVYRPDIERCKDTIDAAYTGLRFVWVRFEGLSEAARVRRAHGVLRAYECEEIGSFECSDPMLNEIWRMCAWSARLCMEDGYRRADGNLGDYDGAHSVTTALVLDRVDRFPWAGDSRIINDAIMHAFGEFGFVKSQLDYFAPRGAVRDGATRFRATGMESLPPYVLDWCLSVLAYVEQSGDGNELRDRAAAILGVLDGWKGPYVAAGFYFFDWDKRIMADRGPLVSEPIMTEAWPAFVLKYVHVGRRMAAVCERYGLADEAATARRLGDERAANWVAVYPDWAQRFGIHVLTLAVLAEIGDAADHRTIFERVFADPEERWTGTPYFGYYVLNALAAMGRHAEALAMLRRYWGRMVELGATTVWEEFEPTWDLVRHQQPPQPYGWGCNSLCQPAGSGPAAWLIREVLGVKPRRPGFAEVAIEPHCGDLAWARGTVPTPMGTVSVAWSKDSGGGLRLETDVPEGIGETRIYANCPRSVRLDGICADASTDEDGRRVLKIQSAGKHVIDLC